MDYESKIKEKYEYKGISFYDIRNRNEIRVIKILPEILEEFPEFEPDRLDIKDIYALALNKLPPRYVQKGTIVLQENVKDEMIRFVLREAISRIKDNPKRI